MKLIQLIKYNKLVVLIITVILSGNLYSQESHEPKEFDTPYGSNEAVGKFVELNGAKIYYEEYGEGEPLLLIHANSGNIESMGNQIDYFKSKYRVIAADNRGHGKSELKTDSLTYNLIESDWNKLVNHLDLDSVNIVGWSDGGILGIKLAITGKTKIKKLVTMGANLRPDTTAVRAWAVAELSKMNQMVNLALQMGDTSVNWGLQKQLMGLMLNQPNIPTSELSKIESKALIMAGDEDIIRNQHTVEIYENIPNAQLCIMPGETHYTPFNNPDLFNSIVDKFLELPFKRPDSNWTK